MEGEHKKELINQEHIRSGIEYSEVNPLEFEREMTMVYLQLKGEFSTQKAVHATDRLTITQDLLTPSVKDVDGLDFTPPPSVTVNCKKAVVSYVDKTLPINTNRIPLQSIVLPKCSDDIYSKGINRRGDTASVKIAGVKIGTISRADAITPSIVNGYGITINIPNKPNKSKKGNNSLAHLIADNNVSLIGIHSRFSIVFDSIFTRESALKRYKVRTPMVTYLPISETQVQEVAGNDTTDRITSRGSTVGNVSKIFQLAAGFRIPDKIESPLAIVASSSIVGSAKLFSADSSAGKNDKIKLSSRNFRASITNIKINDTKFDIRFESPKTILTSLPHVKTESIAHSILQIDDISERERIDTGIPSIGQIAQHVDPDVSNSKVLLDTFNALKIVDSVTVIPTASVSSVDIHRIVPKDSFSVQPYGIVRSRVKMPKQPNAAFSIQKYKTVLQSHETAFNGRSVMLNINDCFDIELRNEFDFLIDIIQNLAAYVPNIRFDCPLPTHAELPNSVIIKSLVLSASKKQFSINRKNQSSILIPHLLAGITDNVDRFSIDTIKNIPVTVLAPVSCAGISTQVETLLKTIYVLPSLSIDAIWANAENVFDFFQQS